MTESWADNMNSRWIHHHRSIHSHDRWWGHSPGLGIKGCIHHCSAALGELLQRCEHDQQRHGVICWTYGLLPGHGRDGECARLWQICQPGEWNYHHPVRSPSSTVSEVLAYLHGIPRAARWSKHHGVFGAMSTRLCQHSVSQHHRNQLTLSQVHTNRRNRILLLRPRCCLSRPQLGEPCGQENCLVHLNPDHFRCGNHCGLHLQQRPSASDLEEGADAT